LVGYPQDGLPYLSKHPDQAPARVHDSPHHVRIRDPVTVWSYRRKPDPQLLDSFSIAFAGGNDRRVPAGLETQGDGDVWEQITQRAMGCQDNPRFAVIYCHIGFPNGHSNRGAELGFILTYS
jgi:hypothetical protein